jgi:hypothetical protein
MLTCQKEGPTEVLMKGYMIGVWRMHLLKAEAMIQ